MLAVDEDGADKGVTSELVEPALAGKESNCCVLMSGSDAAE